MNKRFVQTFRCKDLYNVTVDSDQPLSRDNVQKIFNQILANHTFCQFSEFPKKLFTWNPSIPHKIYTLTWNENLRTYEGAYTVNDPTVLLERCNRTELVGAMDRFLVADSVKQLREMMHSYVEMVYASNVDISMSQCEGQDDKDSEFESSEAEDETNSRKEDCCAFESNLAHHGRLKGSHSKNSEPRKQQYNA